MAGTEVILKKRGQKGVRKGVRSFLDYIAKKRLGCLLIKPKIILPSSRTDLSPDPGKPTPAFPPSFLPKRKGVESQKKARFPRRAEGRLGMTRKKKKESNPFLTTSK